MTLGRVVTGFSKCLDGMPAVVAFVRYELGRGLEVLAGPGSWAASCRQAWACSTVMYKVVVSPR